MAERIDPALEAFLARSGLAAAVCTPVAADWSTRRFYRAVQGERTAIVMAWPGGALGALPATTWLFRDHGVRVPAVHAIDESAGLALLEDLGARTMAQRIDDGEPAEPMMTAAVDLLVRLHRAVRADALNDVPQFGAAEAAERAARYCDWYLPAVGMPASADDRARFTALWRRTWPAAEAVPRTLAHYDFHPGNLFWHPAGEAETACGAIDFQDAVIAPVAFDLACLLQDVRRDYDPDLLSRLHARYCAAFPGLDTRLLDQSIAVIGAQRASQILGNLGRARMEGRLRPRQLGDIARAWDRLRRALDHPANAALKPWYEGHGWPDTPQ